MFFIIETQITKNQDGTHSGTALVSTRADRNDAESQYYRVLQYAAISQTYKHGAFLMTEDCIPIMYKSYTHGEESVIDSTPPQQD